MRARRANDDRASGDETSTVSGVELIEVSDPGLDTAVADGIFGPSIACPNDPNIVWILKAFALGRAPIIVLVGTYYTIVSSTPTFYVSDARVVENGLDTPVNVTLTSSQSMTFGITVSAGTSSQLVDKLQTTVNVSITAQRTTSIGVAVTATVPEHSWVLGQYGVEGYSIVYDAQTIWKTRDGRSCTDQGTQRTTTAAPTVVEGWRLTAM
jgi:hypothetical protein